MKKILLSALFLAASLNLSADDRSKAILEKITSTIKSYATYRVDFTATLPGEFENIAGTFTVSGDKYYLDVYNSVVYSDGKTRYTYNKADNEVIIELNNPQENNILSDPTRIFALYENDFTHTYTGDSTIELRPKKANSMFSSIIIKVDSKGLPKNVTYNLPGLNAQMSLSIVRITPDVKTTMADFVFDKSKYKGVEVIDFR